MKRTYKIQKGNYYINVVAVINKPFFGGEETISFFQIRDGVKGLANTEYEINSNSKDLEHLQGKIWKEIKPTLTKMFMTKERLDKADKILETTRR